MERNTRLLQALTDAFKDQNLCEAVGEAYDFSKSKLYDLKLLLKLTNRLKGHTNSRKELLLDLVTKHIERTQKSCS